MSHEGRRETHELWSENSPKGTKHENVRRGRNREREVPKEKKKKGEIQQK